MQEQIYANCRALVMPNFPLLPGLNCEFLLWTFRARQHSITEHEFNEGNFHCVINYREGELIYENSN